jgi:hypothetical protein
LSRAKEGTGKTPLDAISIQAYNGVAHYAISWDSVNLEWKHTDNSYIDAVAPL